jgi:hypothetical protein
VQAGQLRARDRQLGLVTARVAENPVGAQMQHARRRAGRRPGGLGHPAPRAYRVVPGGRIDPFLHEGAQNGLVEHVVVVGLQAVIPEA